MPNFAATRGAMPQEGLFRIGSMNQEDNNLFYRKSGKIYTLAGIGRPNVDDQLNAALQSLGLSRSAYNDIPIFNIEVLSERSPQGATLNRELRQGSGEGHGMIRPDTRGLELAKSDPTVSTLKVHPSAFDPAPPLGSLAGSVGVPGGQFQAPQPSRADTAGAGFGDQPAAQRQRATLVNPQTGERKAVDVNSQEAQELFGQGFILETQAPNVPATVVSPSGKRTRVDTAEQARQQFEQGAVLEERAPDVPATVIRPDGTRIRVNTAEQARGEFERGSSLERVSPDVTGAAPPDTTPPGTTTSPPDTTPTDTTPPDTTSPDTTPPDTTDPTSGVDMTGWTDAMKKSFEAMQDYIDTLTEQNQRINPSVEITPEMTQKFLEQAKNELGPFFGQLFSQTEQDLKTSFSRIAEDYTTAREALGEQVGEAQRGARENFAKRGLSFTTGEDSIAESEADIARKTQRALTGLEQDTLRGATDVGRRFERELGFSAFPKDSFSIGTGGRAIGQQPGRTGLTPATGSRQLFTPTAGTTGELERRRLFDEQARVRELEDAERQLRAGNIL